MTLPSQNTKRTFDLTGSRIFIAGETGMVGRAIARRLAREKVALLSAPHSELDLTNAEATRKWFKNNQPDAVIMAAARVGGILANLSQPVEFLQDNAAMALNVLQAAHESGVKKLAYLGSSCMYPRECAQPMSEDLLMTGALEPTNSAYAMAKLMGMELAQSYRRQYGADFITLIPCNLYGPFDHFNEQNSHVVPALMLRLQKAVEKQDKEFTVWGSGLPKREFLHVDDAADAIVMALQYYSDAMPLNIGSGSDISIEMLSQMLCRIAGFGGTLAFDSSKPDGMIRKCMDISRLSAMGWKPKIPLEQGLKQSYDWFTKN